MLIKKTTSVAKIRAAYPEIADLIAAYEDAKINANVWDGRRDGLREVLKLVPNGNYPPFILTRSLPVVTTTATADGKYQLQSTLQTDHEPLPDVKVVYISLHPDGRDAKPAHVVKNSALYTETESSRMVITNV